MKGFLILAGAATAHPDGTFSLLRAGLTDFGQSKPGPAKWKATLVVCVRASGAQDIGKHAVRVTLMQDKIKIIEATIDVEIRPRGAANVLMDLDAAVPGPGDYQFVLDVDGQEQDRLDVKGEVMIPKEHA